MPGVVRNALQDAMEIAIGNVPRSRGRCTSVPDVSGSMQSPVTGHRQGATTAVRCIDVAALVAAAILRQNPAAEVMPFEDEVVDVRLTPRDSVMTNAEAWPRSAAAARARAPLAQLNRRGARATWWSSSRTTSRGSMRSGPAGTATMREWSASARATRAQGSSASTSSRTRTTQAAEREDILNVGGFSDQVFDVVAEFAAGRWAPTTGSG